MLAGAGIFVHTRLRADLDERVDDALVARAETSLPGGDEEGLTQLLAQDGRLLAGPGARVLGRAELAQAASGPLWTERRRIAGVEGHARVHARPSRSGIVVVAQSLDDRDEALGSVVQSFAFGGLVAVLLVSLVGYGLARAGLRPVEAMRRRAGEIAIDRDTDAALPLPAAHDEIRRLGETLNDMLARLQTAYERERHFVADASHELRTPIAVVKTELESAVRSGDYGTRARGALLAALEACEHLASLADDLLVLARAGEGALPVRPEALPARATLGGVAQRFGDRAGLHGREIRVEAADDVIVRADPLRLAQALGNLVDNALRHGDGEIVLQAAPDAAGVELEVRDAGPGFTPEIAPHAFERFTRDDRARGGSGGGAGLGLAIVRAIAEAHGGSAAIGPGPGGVVRLWLPGPQPVQDALRQQTYGAVTQQSTRRHTNDS